MSTIKVGRFEVEAPRTRTGRPAEPQRVGETDEAYAKRLKSREKTRRYREKNPTYFRDWHRKAVKEGRAPKPRQPTKARVRRRYAHKRAWLDDLKNVPCMDCGGEFHPDVMEFDHRDPSTKEFCVGAKLMSASQSRLEAEITKCDVICVCCHRVRTHIRRAPYVMPTTASALAAAKYRARRAIWLDHQKGDPCMDCGERFEACAMDFDHRPGDAKAFEVGAGILRALHKVKAEIAKCDLVCANCHRVRTAERKRATLKPRT